jgi:hypothetical protein
MKKPKGKKGGGKGTGKIRAHTVLPGMGKDPHASAAHHSANAAQGMPQGLGTNEMTQAGQPQEEGGENCEMC